MGVDWASVLRPDTPLLEIVVRGTIVYLVLYVLLRVLRRQAGDLGVNDLLVIVLIADAAQNAMAHDYTSVSDGVLLVAVIIGWAWVIDWLTFHVRWVERLLSPPPRTLVKDGRMQRATMRRELVTEEELMGQLRLNGIEDLGQVRSVRLESDGRISVIQREQQHRPAEDRRGG